MRRLVRTFNVPSPPRIPAYSGHVTKYSAWEVCYVTCLGAPRKFLMVLIIHRCACSLCTQGGRLYTGYVYKECHRIMNYLTHIFKAFFFGEGR